MAQSVVVLSSQLITTLSALAYLRWRGIRGTRLHVVSLYRDDLSHSSKAFQPLLHQLSAQDGHQCQFIQIPPDQFGVLRLSAGDSVLIGPEPLKCSLLLLPRLDDREGQRMLLAYQAAEVVELGESIGVETCLYSPAGRRERRRVLRRLRCSEGRAVVRQDPLVPLDQPVDLARLRCLLDLCAVCRASLAETTSSNSSPFMGVMLCLPYLKLQSWRFRWRLMGRSLGWRQVPVIENRSYFRRAVGSALRHLPAAAPVAVQAHPRNEAHHGLIDQLLRPLRPNAVLEVLPSTDPLEVRLSSEWSPEGGGRWRVLGFGTNLLAAAVFLAPDHRGVTLCQPADEGWWWRWSDQWLNRREWRRNHHLRRLLNNLLAALDQLAAHS